MSYHPTFLLESSAYAPVCVCAGHLSAAAALYLPDSGAAFTAFHCPGVWLLLLLLLCGAKLVQNVRIRLIPLMLGTRLWPGHMQG